ncbi:replication protein, partial [Staphylococcus aureus]|uniref:replication protein n=1 Tax=Staphylococcus aureus TaxID=1280 RepID=UPI000BD8814A
GAGRTRNWTFVVYPESVVENWRDILDGEHVQWIESPLHDKDVDPNGEIKKSHWHILIMFESVKTYEQVLAITTKINATVPQKCNAEKGLVRYMAHLDNPEKFQYSKSDIIGHGGADVMELLKPNSSDRYALIREMLEFIDENNFIEFKDLMNYAMRERFDDWFPLLCDNSAYVVQQYLKSNRHRAGKNMEKIND